MPYNCLRGAYEKPRLVQGISKAPLRHPWGPAKALGHEHKRNGPSLFPFFFSSLLSLFLLSFCTVLHVFIARLALLYTSGLFLVFVFHLFCLSVFTLLILFCSMRGTHRNTDQIVTLVWILSGTMNTTFRRTRRRTYILNMSSKRRKIRGALETTEPNIGSCKALIRSTF